MKIIVSHDVDHLYGKDHWGRDLIYPKLWVRESIRMIKHDISVHEWLARITSCFKKERNHIEELVEFDKKHGVHSTFFFGMAQGLGMSYHSDEAMEKINFVIQNGFDVGIHGIEYNDINGINKEKNIFESLVGNRPSGIRMHYVRYNDSTFEKLNNAAYEYDSTEFDKKKGVLIKPPYKIGNMWEFPLCIMDGYLPYDINKAKIITLNTLQAAELNNIKYFTILFHDYMYDGGYSVYKNWYEWFIEMCVEKNYRFISFKEARKELE